MQYMEALVHMHVTDSFDEQNVINVNPSIDSAQ